jgi:hypothetical protein
LTFVTGYTPVKPQVHGHLIPQDVARELFKDEKSRSLRKRLPVTPVNSPAEALTNNPFSEILVSEEEVLRGPEIVDEHTQKIRDEEAIAHQKSLHNKTLHELLTKLGERLEKVEERRAEANSQAYPFFVFVFCFVCGEGV